MLNKYYSEIIKNALITIVTLEFIRKKNYAQDYDWFSKNFTC